MIPPSNNFKQDANAALSTEVPLDSDLGRLTTGSGGPVQNNQASMTVGDTGPILLQDINLIDKLAHFGRERIPDRVVHAKGAGAHGYFEVTKDISHLTCAKFLGKVGKRTPMFARFSVVSVERGSPDTVRNPRGFALKFYTEEGNYDMVGNNTPIFFIRDPILFPDFVHTQKPDPRTNMANPDMQWDFLSHVPESMHELMLLFSERGLPDGYRHMHGYSSHTYKFINDEGVAHYFKWHFRTNQGIKNLSVEKAAELQVSDPDYSTRDLFESIERGEYPSWTAYIQVMTEEEALNYKYDVFDVTKVISQKDFPLQEVGRFVLNRNPENYFAEVEQAAFSPANMVPGIAPSPDRILQGRLIIYQDTQSHRMGPNYQQLPINKPLVPVLNQQRDGRMCFTNNGGRLPNYQPNSFGGPSEDPRVREVDMQSAVKGYAGRHTIKVTEADFEQPRKMFSIMSKSEQQYLIDNFAGALSLAQPVFQRKIVPHLKRIDSDYGSRIEAILKQKNADY